MNNRRSLSLTPRKENTREIQPVNPPIQFTLNEIMHHFIFLFSIWLYITCLMAMIG